MESFVRRFIRSSLIWFGVGMLIGVAMAIWPRALLYRPAHVHANLLGFVSMMIFGVAYHVLPRFTGAPLHSRRLAGIQLWVSNAGLALMVGGWFVRPSVTTAGQAMLGTGGVASALGGGIFIYNLWRTLDAAQHPRGRGAAPEARATTPAATP